MRKGLIDLSSYDFQKNAPVNLSGEWEFYMSELIPPREFALNKDETKDYIDFPSTWNELSKSLDPGDGFATYRVRVLVDAPKKLALELPHFYSSYTIWINSTVVAYNGIVGMNKNSSVPQWRPQTIIFDAQKDTLDMVIQASNFFHAKGGVREQIRIGDPDRLTFKRDVAVNGTLTMASILGVTAVVFFFIYFFIKREISTLYFAALSFTWGLRSLFSNLYVFTDYIPEFPWETAVKIEYISLYLVMIWAILFVSSLFKSEVNTIFKWVMCLCNLFFVIVTFAFDASLYTQFLPVYLSFCGVLILYIMYVLIRAFVYERDGVVFMVICLFLGVIIFSYDIIAYEGFATFNPLIINTGYILMFILMGLCMVYQLGFLKKSSSQHNVLTYEDLYGSPRNQKK